MRSQRDCGANSLFGARRRRAEVQVPSYACRTPVPGCAHGRVLRASGEATPRGWIRGPGVARSEAERGRQAEKKNRTEVSS